jgi:hypothetical protein
VVKVDVHVLVDEARCEFQRGFTGDRIKVYEQLRVLRDSDRSKPRRLLESQRLHADRQVRAKLADYRTRRRDPLPPRQKG